MFNDRRKENLNLYACLLRKYYIGEEDYMYVIFSNLVRTELNDAWNHALEKIKHEERIKNISSITLGAFSTVMKRYDSFENYDQIIRYLLSNFKPSELKLFDENVERRLRYLLAINVLKALEENINFPLLDSGIEKKSKKDGSNFHETLKKKASVFKKFKRAWISLFFILVSILGYFIFNNFNKLESLNAKLIEKSELQKNNLEQKIDSINKEISLLNDENFRLNNLLQNEDYLKQVLNETKYKKFKQNGFSGDIYFQGIFGYESIKGSLVNGEERGVWVYEKYNGEKEVYRWIASRVGAICRDGDRSYATGRGACSHHGGVDYWLNEYQRVKVND